MELYDLTRYFHNVRNDKGEICPILGEDELAITAAVSYLLEDINFVIKAYSGTGKTVIMNAIFGLLPEEYYHTIEHLSETAVWYEADKINRARFVAIPEAQKLPEPVMEVIKTWGDGRAAFRKRTDVTIGDVVEQRLNAKYVFMCIAVENSKGAAIFDAELERRCMIGHTNPTVKQTERVIKHKLLDAAVPKTDLITMSDEEIEDLKKHIIAAIGRRDDENAVVLRNPCAPFIYDAIPSIFPVSRSKVIYLLKVIQAVARFYPDEIIKFGKGKVKYGLITPKHTWMGLRIYLDTFVSECLHMPSHGTDILKLFPDSRLDRFGMVGDTVKLTVREIKSEAKRAGLPFTKLSPILGALVMTGFLEQDDSEKGRPKYFKSPLISEPVAKINWSELIASTKEFMKERWPEVADEYISRFCEKIDIIDPITGKELSLDTKDKKAKRILPEGSVFSTKDDEELWKGGDGKIITFLLSAIGDYDEENLKEIEKIPTDRA